MTDIRVEPVLRIDDLSVEFGSRRMPFRAVDEVSLTVGRGETVGLVGESGSGKSTIGNAVLGLAPVRSGSIHFEGEDITHARPGHRRRISARLQVIFQDPYSSLNPSRTIRDILVEPLLVHEKLTRGDAMERVGAMLERVGLDRTAGERFPGHFSGGQRQRIAIARALMVSPDLVICDEAVSALDLSVQAQVLNLLMSLQQELGMSYLFVSHDLTVVRHMSDRIVVLFRGKVMENGAAAIIHDSPAHPYTQALLSASPIPDPVRQREQRDRISVALAPARPAAVTSFCPFAARCPIATEICEREAPPLAVGPTGSLVACHHSDVAVATSGPALPTTHAVTVEGVS